MKPNASRTGRAADDVSDVLHGEFLEPTEDDDLPLRVFELVQGPMEDSLRLVEDRIKGSDARFLEAIQRRRCCASGAVIGENVPRDAVQPHPKRAFAAKSSAVTKNTMKNLLNGIFTTFPIARAGHEVTVELSVMQLEELAEQLDLTVSHPVHHLGVRH